MSPILAWKSLPHVGQEWLGVADEVLAALALRNARLFSATVVLSTSAALAPEWI